MTIGIKTQNNEVLVFTTATLFSESYSSKITEHPVEGRRSVVDHAVHDEPSFRVEGVFVPVDLHGAPEEVEVFLGSTFNPSDDFGAAAYTGSTGVGVDSVVIKTGKDSIIGSSLPNSIANLGTIQKQEVSLSQVSASQTIEGFKQRLLALRSSSSVVSIFMFDNGVVTEFFDDCLIESISIDTDESTGDALFVSLSIKRVSFATLGSATIPTLTWKEIDLSSKKDGSKGSQQGDSYGKATPDSSKPQAAAVKAFDSCQTEIGRLSPINCLKQKGTQAVTDFILDDGVL